MLDSFTPLGSHETEEHHETLQLQFKETYLKHILTISNIYMCLLFFSGVIGHSAAFRIRQISRPPDEGHRPDRPVAGQPRMGSECLVTWVAI